MFVDVEQVQLAAQAPVVTLLGLFQHREVLLQLLFAGPGGAIDALQHLIAMVATPVGTRHLHQLEKTQLARAGHVGATAQVLKCALAVQRDVLVAGNAGDDLGLVMLAQPLEVGHSLVAWQHAAHHGLILGSQLGHAFLDGDQILGREGALIGEVVEKTVLDHRANRHLGIGKQLLHRIGQQVGGGMANHLQAIRILGRDDGQRAVLGNLVTRVHDARLAISAGDFAGQRSLGQPGTNGRSHLGYRHRTGIFAQGTVGKRNLDHGYVKDKKRGQKKTRISPRFLWANHVHLRRRCAN